MDEISFQRDPNFFKMSLKTSVLTVITFGVYYFWRKAERRKSLWNSVTIEEDRLTYHGTGLETFLGFLIVTIVLSIALGIVAAIANFLSPPGQEGIYSMFAIYATLFLVLIPFAHLAKYFTLKYTLSRTRFRGIRAGIETGAAKAYVLNGVLVTLASIFTLGLAAPWGRAKLARQLTSQMRYGTLSVKNTVKASDMYKVAWPMFLITAIFMIVILTQYRQLSFLFTQLLEGYQLLPEDSTRFLLLLGGIYLILLPLIAVFRTFYTIRGIRAILNATTLGESMQFGSQLQARYFILYHVLFYVVWSILLLLVVLVFAIIGSIFADLSEALIVPVVVIGYLFVIVISIVTYDLLVVEKLIEISINSTSITNLSEAKTAKQRPEDEALEGEGFAEAFDIDLGLGI